MEFVWCILVTTLIGVSFKLFPGFKVNTFNAIVVNYTICLLLGTLIDPASGRPFSPEIIRADWFKFDVALGFLFIIGFNLTAKAIQRTGITMPTFMQRMSIILTVTFTVLLFHEPFGWMEFCGILFALIAILAINQKSSNFTFKGYGPFPFILLAVLMLSAAIEILLFYVEATGVVGQQQMAFTTHGFGTAAIIGWLVMGWMAIKRKFTLSLKDIIAGTLLGVPNFFSIFLLLKMLNQGWDGSIMYPLVNVSVLLCSTGVAVLFFKEKLNRINWIGIAMACLSILLIAYAHNTSH